MIAGLEEITDGEILIGGRRVNDLEPRERDVAMVFQSYALYPHMNVAGNLGFSLALKRTPAEAARKAVEGAAEALQLSPYLERLPRALSGGQRQRVAMGRAIVRQPQVFLFDEPLSNLDAQLRVQMRTEVRRLHQQLGATSVYVTHDQVEAMTMADRIIVLGGGRMVQAGSPLQLYERPVNRFVAEFIGSPAINVLAGEISAIGRLAVGSWEVDLARGVPPGPIEIGIRPEDLSPVGDGGLSGTVSVVEHLGAETYVFVEAAGRQICWRVSGTPPIAVGERLSLSAEPSRLHLFEPQTGARIA
jgi:multiple sugar transport system ATP-binding protein